MTEMKNTDPLNSFVPTDSLRLYKNIGISCDWAVTLLEILYVKFNDDSIPRDLGGQSIVIEICIKVSEYIDGIHAGPRLPQQLDRRRDNSYDA